ncbi:MAG TPA: hypothetical protein P5556_03730 [Candidatus Gastranaerophilales bacterium]|nr:hypothetical protein [Candidatus Gastranaerophilales bacterium]
MRVDFLKAKINEFARGITATLAVFLMLIVISSVLISGNAENYSNEQKVECTGLISLNCLYFA